MLQLENETPYAVDRAVLVDGDGNKVWVVAAKATFRIADDGACTPDREPEPVIRVPQFAGEPGASTLLREGELVVAHPGTTVTLNASAYAPLGRTSAAVDAGIEVGPIRKFVRVTGDRWWVRTRRGVELTEAQPFATMPITWERAFGGREPAHDGGERPYPANPVGCGLALPREQDERTPVPNVEYASDAVRAPDSRPAPAGLAAIPSGWSPRLELAGTFDAAWQATRAPIWPLDYDPRYHLAAPANQVAPDRLRGGETVTLHNLTHAGRLTFRLPRVHVSFDTFLRRGGRVSPRGQLDRVLLEPSRRRLAMVWRAAINCAGDARAVDVTVVSTKRVLW